VLWSEKVYLVPRNDGRILAGATVEYVGFDKHVTAGAVNKILSDAIELAPGLAKCSNRRDLGRPTAGLSADPLADLGFRPISMACDGDGTLSQWRAADADNGTAQFAKWITEKRVSVDWDRLSPTRFAAARRETAV